MPIASKPSFSWIPNGVAIAGQGGQVMVRRLRTIAGVGGGTEEVNTQTEVDPLCVLNVALWRLRIENKNVSLPMSGGMGAERQRMAMNRFSFAAEVVWDAINPPDTLLNNGTTVALAFQLGDRLSYPVLQQDGPSYGLLGTGNVGINPNPAPAHKYYFAPSAICNYVEPASDSRGDVVRQNVAGIGDGMVFLLPDEVDWLKTYIRYRYAGDSGIAEILAAAWDSDSWGEM